MRCPYCGFENTKVIDSRQEGDVVRRRRECEKCGKRFTTYERAEIELYVIKKDGRREPFDRNKLRIGILKACEKRPISREQIEEMIDEIERALRKKDKIEISSREIGNCVMRRLKRLDPVAYVRFASVYKEFKDIEEFEEVLSKLKK